MVVAKTEVMMGKSFSRTALRGCTVAAVVFAGSVAVLADETPVTKEQFLQLKHQNEQMLQQLQEQQKLIDALGKKVSDLEAGASRHLETNAPAVETSVNTGQEPPSLPPSNSSFRFGNVALSGEGGVAFFKSQSNGQHPHSAFRIDEARLFLDAPIWKDVYFYSELTLAKREDPGLDLDVAELYVDFEDVSKLWERDGMLNVRAGRFYTPFGEEYIKRFAINNPLISHSVSDIWGSDDGIELYGNIAPVRYAVAVQNGGGSGSGPVTGRALQDDKSVAGRIGVDAAPWLYASVSAMRTGNLSVKNGISAIWFGNGFFRSIGSPATTTFHANLVEGDVQLRFPFALIRAAGGYVAYGDNDPAANNGRDVYYYYVEGTHDWTPHFYSAARWSQVLAHNGFPIVGNGNMGTYGFGELTSDYWRLSLGVGYRFSPDLVLKGEYSFNQGRQPDGGFRGHENEFALEAAFKF